MLVEQVEDNGAVPEGNRGPKIPAESAAKVCPTF